MKLIIPKNIQVKLKGKKNLTIEIRTMELINLQITPIFE